MTDMRVDKVAIPAVTDLPSPAPDSPLEALSWLGDTVEEVAEGLRARGIKGNRSGGATDCVIAEYLKLWYGGTPVFISRIACLAGHRSFVPPKPIGDFIWQWDSYQFPDLIDNG